MMDFANAHLYDPIVWMRLTRVALFIAIAFMMFWEPFVCGGRNRTFHRLLGVFFIMSAWNAHEAAEARSIVLATSPGILSGVDLFPSEVALTVMVIIVFFILVLQAVKWHALNKVKPQYERRSCEHHFQP